MNATHGTTEALKMNLETEPCTRCHGSGHYSRCQQYGTTCFRCMGRKVTLTKRGAAAAKYLRALRSKPYGQVVVGDVIEVHVMLSTKWSRVTAVGPCDTGGWRSMVNGVMVPVRADLLTITCEESGICGAPPEEVVRVRQSAEDAARTLALALEYQATLTKSGTPRKAVAQ